MKYILTYICLILLINIVRSDYTLTTVYFKGGRCSICSPSQNPEPRNYACSNRVGFWDDGRKFFENQIPQGNTLTEITAVMIGDWSCIDYYKHPFAMPAKVNLTLQSSEIETNVLSSQCECFDQCSEATFHWQNDNGFPGYNYNTSGLNRLQVHVLEGLICVNQITLNLTYTTSTGSRTTPPVPVLTCDSFGGCLNNGTCVANLTTNTASCNCPRFYYGPNCQCYVPTYNLITDHPAVLDTQNSGFLSKDTLYLTVNNSVKYFDTKITFVNSINGTCDYPSPSVDVTWTRTFDADLCVYTYEVIIPWGTAWPACIFNRTVTDEWILFEGIMNITNEEVLNDIDLPGEDLVLTRTLIQKIPFIVRYPTSINLVVENITIYADAVIQAAVVQQYFTTSSTQPPGVGYVQLLTASVYPFKLVSPYSLSGDASGATVNVSSDAANGVTTCLDDGTNCVQYWDIYIDPFLNACNFDGAYVFNFTISCDASRLSDCPYDSSSTDNTGAIVMFLTSGDFCPVIVETVDLSGSLTSYGDFLHTDPKSNFVVDQMVYFVALVNSTKATIINSTVSMFEVLFSNGTSLVLSQNGVNTLAGNLADCLITNVPPLENDIQLDLTPLLFSPSNQLSELFTFMTTIDVEYFNTQKRTILYIHEYSALAQSSSPTTNNVGNYQSAITVSSNSNGTPNSSNSNGTPKSVESDSTNMIASFVLMICPILILFI